MRRLFATQRQLRWALIGVSMFAVAAATLVFAWPAGAYDLDPRSNEAIGHTETDTNASPWTPAEDGRRGIARVLLAQRLGVSAESLEFVGEQAVNWPDTSLGCGEPGRVYAKVIVPGYRIMFDYDGASYEVHTTAKSGLGYHPAPASCEGGIAHDRSTD